MYSNIQFQKSWPQETDLLYNNTDQWGLNLKNYINIIRHDMSSKFMQVLCQLRCMSQYQRTHLFPWYVLSPLKFVKSCILNLHCQVMKYWWIEIKSYVQFKINRGCSGICSCGTIGPLPIQSLVCMKSSKNMELVND